MVGQFITGRSVKVPQAPEFSRRALTAVVVMTESVKHGISRGTGDSARGDWALTLQMVTGDPGSLGKETR